MNINKISVKNIFIAAFFMIVALSIFSACAPNDKQVDATLAAMVEHVNKDLPQMMNAYTRLDSLTALPGRKICYNNTLVESLNIDETSIEGFKESINSTLLTIVKNASGLETFRKKNVIFIYKYEDKTGKEFAVFEYGPQDYK